MAYPTTVHIIGGHGGNAFSFDGQNDGATLEKIGVWVGGWQVKAVKIWLTNGEVRQFGAPGTGYQEFKFEPGEFFASLSLWGNGAGTRLGAIKFKTSRNREFFVKMTDWGLKTEYPIDVASGICLGVIGRAGSDIDGMGFIFINAIESTVMTDIEYPTLNQVVPQVNMEEIKSMTYTNSSSVAQEYTLETSKTITKTSSWSVTNNMQFTFNMQVKAGIPELAEVSTGFSWTVGVQDTYGVENKTETTEKLSFKIQVPAGKTMEVAITLGHANVDLPYKGIVKVTCRNGSVLEFDTSGVYKGLNYTKGSVVVKQGS
ncbi:aerolysin-like protein [Lepisosteus oculatus]|uniref:aerolysin-like protein n=1 Tax=Lepisosteus oculatus TaxID=7918 RepID=UPI0037159EF1